MNANLRLAASAVSLTLFGIWAAACSSPDKANTSDLELCSGKSGSASCPEKKKSTNKSGDDDVPGLDAPARGSTAADDAGKPQPERDAADAAPVMGKECRGLAACCAEVGAAGYDTTMCKRVLSTNNEDACWLKHKSLKDFGDCT